jgi:hypothetical protein
MLQCLDRPHRLAYVLGEILELPGPEAAEILDLAPDLFRKRLQLARTAIVAFTRSHCGLASDQAPCRCNRQVAGALKAGRLRPEACALAARAVSFEQTRGRSSGGWARPSGPSRCTGAPSRAPPPSVSPGG